MFKKNFITRPKPLRTGVLHRQNTLILTTLLLFLFVFSGCQTIPTLPPVNLSAPGWNIHQGQAVWRSKKDAPEIAGDLLLATHPDGRSFVQFTKTPLPFVVAQTTSNSWQIQFVPVNKIYSAHGRPPAQLAWLHLAQCLDGAPPPKKWKWERLDNGGFRFQNPSTGESLEGYLNP
jgi:hypothetical protein